MHSVRSRLMSLALPDPAGRRRRYGKWRATGFHRLIFAVIIIFSFSAHHTARAQIDFTELFGGAGELAHQMGIDPTLIRKPTPEEWQMFWQTFNGVLQSNSLEDMAELLPYADMALSYLDKVPEARPYADWLRQRMDYLSIADEIVKEERRTIKPPPPSPKIPGKPAPPPAKPVPPSPKSSANKTMDASRWEKKIASRPVPKTSAHYVPLLKPIFKREGVPESLVWLAEVESSFDPEAKSPVGARGLYQFMPSTAQRFGLSLNPEDERIVPERSAYAAAKYLKFLHGRFGSWPLALAAYNAGEGRVGKLMSTHKATSFEGIADFLPAETRMYVPKVSAVVKLREGVDLKTL